MGPTIMVGCCGGGVERESIAMMMNVSEFVRSEKVMKFVSEKRERECVVTSLTLETQHELEVQL